MNYEHLLTTASFIPKVSAKTCNEYEQKKLVLIAKMNSLLLERPDLISLIGEDNKQMMKDNHANHVRFILSYISHPIPEVLTDTVLWVFRAYRTHGFSSNYWPAQLNGWSVILKNELSDEAFNEISPLYDWMITNIPTFVKVSDIQLKKNNSLH
ncbi:hypothetical protein [Draconibacterium halophilum]|uniref:Uncharacterized protein n=1 Tax=Draconibacterium halophilum TaxID=2706887 RepID=A0A6C0RI85_9BACT|nr:hypothetical protein [Draconibacterium halophilum]QIA09253.1 hypothetical protein G0Q07_16730 [Draconibacterium halophilum]